MNMGVTPDAFYVFSFSFFFFLKMTGLNISATGTLLVFLLVLCVAAGSLSADEQLWDAVINNDIATATEILQDSPSLNPRWRDSATSATALHVAAVSGFTDLVRLLKDHPGSQVNIKDSRGQTAFLLACWQGRTEVVKVLLRDSRVLVNDTDNSKSTPLLWAAVSGNVEVVKWIIALRGPELSVDQEGLNELRVASQGEGDEAMNAVEEVREAVDILAKFTSDSEGTREALLGELQLKDVAEEDLVSAILSGDEAMAKEILKDNPAINLEARVVGEQVSTAFEAACTHNLPLARLMASHPRARDDHDQATCAGLGGVNRVSGPQFRALVEGHQAESLHLRALTFQNDDVEGVRLLLASSGHGVGERLEDDGHRTLMHLACEFGATRVASFLLEHAALDLSVADDLGRTPAWECARQGDVAITKLMAESGQDLALQTKGFLKAGGSSYTPMELAHKRVQRATGDERSAFLEIYFVLQTRITSPADAPRLEL